MARALAILGMVMVHFGPFDADEDLLSRTYRLTYGRASVLFVLLAGVGISLLFRAKPAREARLRIGWRVIVFFPLGVMLQVLPTPVAVILQFYALYYLVGGLVAGLPTRWLVALTAAWTVIAPLFFITIMDPSLAGRGGADTLTDPGRVVGDLLLTGYYPLITWAPPLLVGLLVGRTDLRATATRVALALGGAATATAAYGGAEIGRAVTGTTSDYLLAEGHTGAPLNVLGATGVAVAVLGVCLLLASALPRVTWPVVAVGQLALTVYVTHLIVLALAPEWLEGRDAAIDAVRKVARFYVITTVLCLAWRARFARGPLEALLALPFTLTAARRAPTVSSAAPQHDQEGLEWHDRDRSTST